MSVSFAASHQFSGRISKLNQTGRLARIKVETNNIKYLNRRDRVEFWNETYPQMRCTGLVEGKSNTYLLLRVPQYDQCITMMHFTTGSYLFFESEDLQTNIKAGKELIEILQKKKQAYTLRKKRMKNDLESYVDRVDTLNKRYEVLRQKLEIEWQDELAALEEDKAKIFQNYKDAQARLNEIDMKLESYRIEDEPLTLDRWALDPKLYFKK